MLFLLELHYTQNQFEYYLSLHGGGLGASFSVNAAGTRMTLARLTEDHSVTLRQSDEHQTAAGATQFSLSPYINLLHSPPKIIYRINKKTPASIFKSVSKFSVFVFNVSEFSVFFNVRASKMNTGFIKDLQEISVTCK
jgi:hypothetical protein